MNARTTLLLLLFLPVAAVAADQCFCLQNKDDHFRHSCEKQQQGYRQVVQCRDDEGKPYKIDDTNGWTEIPAGQGRCNPCRQPLNTRGGDIRGNNDQQSVKDVPDEHPK